MFPLFVLRLPRKMTMDTSKVLRLPRKLPRIFGKRRKSIAPATQNDFRHVTRHFWMSQSATPTTRNEATKRWKPPKMTPPAKLTIGTAIRGSRGRLRRVADGCDRERNVERTNPQPPDPQSETGTLATHSGKTCTMLPKRDKNGGWNNGKMFSGSKLGLTSGMWQCALGNHHRKNTYSKSWN